MTNLELAAIASTVVFAGISLILSIRQRFASQELKKQEAFEKQRLYQISILKQIQDKIGYSLDVEKIAEVITGSLRHLFAYSSASSMVIKNDKIIFKTDVEQTVGPEYIDQVRKNMIMSLNALMKTPPIHIEEHVSGNPLDDRNKASVASFFNIPLAIGNEVVGLINVSSTSKDLYHEQEVTILYQIVAQASEALTKLQQILATEKGKLTSMIGSLADGVFMVDTNWNIMIINESAMQFLRLKSEKVVFTDIISSFGTQYNILGKINQALRENKQIVEEKMGLNDKVFKTFITPVPDLAGGKTSGSIGASILLHDVTIEQNINTIKEDFTHMIVHELRAPLTAIKDSSELMLEVFEDKGEIEKEQQKRLLHIIDQQSKSLLEQINHVLDAAKIEGGRFIISKSPCDMAEIIQNAIEPFVPQAQKLQILILSDIYFPLPAVDVDPIRITQVLNNLISNSLKFTQPGGKITISAKLDGNAVTVAVKDTGIGIPENEQEELFSKYYQIRTTPHQLAKKGTGLGLYITKGIVEAHGGTVGVISKPGEGTTIYFKIPVKDGAPQIIKGHLPQATVSNMVN